MARQFHLHMRGSMALQLLAAAAAATAVGAAADTSSRETGLNLAVATMRPGERAAVYIADPKYGYGEKGSFSFPSVPPACQLVYEVDMLTWEPPAEVGAGPGGAAPQGGD